MKKAHKVIIWVIVAIIAVFAVINLTVPSIAKKIIVEQIEANLKMKASLGGFSITPPLSINLTNLEIGDLLKVERISVSPNILGFFAGKIVLSGLTIIDPVITLEQSREGKLNIPQLEAKGEQPPIYITGLIVRNGKIIFNDRKINPQGLKTIIGRLNVNISKVVLPLTSLKTNFDISGDVLKPDDSKLGSFIFSGWLDFGPKDMDGIVTIKDLDGTYFSPYYGSFISSRKLLTANLNTKTTFKSKNNALATLTNFRLSNLTYAKLGEEGPLEVPSLSLSRNALDFFTDSAGNLDLEFEVNTKLDKPELTILQLEKIILKAAAKNLVRQNPEDLIKKVNSNIEQIKVFGKGLEDLFKDKQ